MVLKILVIFLVLALTSCSSLKQALPPHQIVIAIDEEFKPVNIADSDHVLQKQITKAYDKSLQSLSGIFGYKYYPNYRLSDYHQATLVLIGRYGSQDDNPSIGKYFIKGKFINTGDSSYPVRDTAYELDLGVRGDDSAGLFSDVIRFAVKHNNSKRDSDVPVVPTTLRMSG